MYLRGGVLLLTLAITSAAPPSVTSSASIAITAGASAADAATVAPFLGSACTFSWDAVPPTPRPLPPPPAASQAPAGSAAALAAQASALVDALAGTCFPAGPTSDAGGWTYVVCLGVGPTAAVTQRSGVAGQADATAIRVGTRDGAPPARIGGVPSDVSRVEFWGGEPCGAQARTATVTLHCGSDMAILSAVEASICTYSLDASHPSLCALETHFPRFSAEKAAAARAAAMGGQSGGGTGAPAPPPPVVKGPAALVASLPLALRAALGAPAEADGTLSSGDGGLVRDAPPVSSDGLLLSSEDALGMGGRSLGVDDSERHGGSWAGLNTWTKDTVSPWVVEAYPTFGGAGAGGEGASGSRSSTTRPRQWRCVAYGADDMRKGTERNGAGRRGSGSVPLTAAQLTLQRNDADAPLRVVAVSARGYHRQGLIATASATAQGGISVTWVLPQASPSPEGVPTAPTTDVASFDAGEWELGYLSVTVEEAAGPVLM